jgi:hypothetical protein
MDLRAKTNRVENFMADRKRRIVILIIGGFE